MTPRLRVLPDARARAATLAQLRARLGGHATGARAGEIIDHGGALGVVFDADATHAHVWLGGGRARRVELARVSSRDALAPGPLVDVARRARELGALREGDRVVFRDRDRDGEGTVAERCRFGVIVARADGTMVGVGFTRLVRERRDA